MKDKTKKYVAGTFMGILFGIHSIYGYLPKTETIVLAQDSVPVEDGRLTDSPEVALGTASSTQTETTVDESRHVVLIATTSETSDIPTPPPVFAVVAPTPIPSPTPKPVAPVIQPPVPPKTNTTKGYVDGTYVGTRENAYYGYVQVQLTFKDGVITNAIALESPSKQRESQKINARAIPKLQTETVVAQSGSVDAISGATYTSKAFKKSLASAIQEAKA